MSHSCSLPRGLVLLPTCSYLRALQDLINNTHATHVDTKTIVFFATTTTTTTNQQTHIPAIKTSPVTVFTKQTALTALYPQTNSLPGVSIGLLVYWTVGMMTSLGGGLFSICICVLNRNTQTSVKALIYSPCYCISYERGLVLSIFSRIRHDDTKRGFTILGKRLQ